MPTYAGKKILLSGLVVLVFVVGFAPLLLLVVVEVIGKQAFQLQAFYKRQVIGERRSGLVSFLIVFPETGQVRIDDSQGIAVGLPVIIIRGRVVGIDGFVTWLHLFF